MFKRESLKKYKRIFQQLKVDRAHGLAPHKPILLLSIIDNIETKEIKSNRIFITTELVASFKNNWSQLVITNHNPIFSLPFYHLESDGFWKLIPNTGFEKVITIKGVMRSFKNLTDAVNHAIINKELYNLLYSKESRDILRKVIIQKYFPKSKTYDRSENYKIFIDHIEDKILKESSNKYKAEYVLLDEEDIYLRGTLFKRVVPKIYNYSCCISNLNISIIENISMIDACHIIPFSESHDDTISNGISLCPNLHRAFDRGLISIDENYRVLVSNSFKENFLSDYNIKKFEGKDILLPKNHNYYPSIENLRWHRTNRFMK